MAWLSASPSSPRSCQLHQRLYLHKFVAIFPCACQQALAGVQSMQERRSAAYECLTPRSQSTLQNASAGTQGLLRDGTGCASAASCLITVMQAVSWSAFPGIVFQWVLRAERGQRSKPTGLGLGITLMLAPCTNCAPVHHAGLACRASLRACLDPYSWTGPAIASHKVANGAKSRAGRRCKQAHTACPV